MKKEAIQELIVNLGYIKASEVLAQEFESKQKMIQDLQDPIMENLVITPGVRMISDERKRQMDNHGYSLERDKKIYHGKFAEDLALAAATYAIPDNVLLPAAFSRYQALYPWNEKSFKPSPDNRLRELQKAGALIAAAIDVIIDSAEKVGQDKVNSSIRAEYIPCSFPVNLSRHKTPKEAALKNNVPADCLIFSLKEIDSKKEYRFILDIESAKDLHRDLRIVQNEL